MECLRKGNGDFPEAGTPVDKRPENRAVTVQLQMNVGVQAKDAPEPCVKASPVWYGASQMQDTLRSGAGLGIRGADGDDVKRMVHGGLWMDTRRIGVECPGVPGWARPVERRPAMFRIPVMRGRDGESCSFRGFSGD